MAVRREHSRLSAHFAFHFTVFDFPTGAGRQRGTAHDDRRRRSRDLQGDRGPRRQRGGQHATLYLAPRRWRPSPRVTLRSEAPIMPAHKICSVEPRLPGVPTGQHTSVCSITDCRFLRVLTVSDSGDNSSCLQFPVRLLCGLAGATETNDLFPDTVHYQPAPARNHARCGQEYMRCMCLHIRRSVLAATGGGAAGIQRCPRVPALRPLSRTRPLKRIPPLFADLSLRRVSPPS